MNGSKADVIKKHNLRENDFVHGPALRGMTFPQLKLCLLNQKMPTLACGWPLVHRHLLFQSLS